MVIIDTHAHLVPQSFPACPEDVPANEWPEMKPLDDGRARMVIDGKEFRVFEAAYWDMAGRIDYMDREGITIQILSPLPELLGYWFNVRTTVAIADHVHHTIAGAVAQAPTRLAGLGMLPLQDIDLSIETLGRIEALGLKGALIASNVNGVSIADARFDPVYGEAERLGLAIMVHGYRPAGTERLLGSPLLASTIGVPQDTMAAIASFIMTDIFGRFPTLKLGFVQGGGTMGAVIDRMNHVWNEFPQMRAALATSPRDYIRKFHFDTVTFGAEYLRYLLHAYGSDGLMAGTDGPTPIGQRDLAKFVGAACDDATVAEKILWRNAAQFFNLDTMVAAHSAVTASGPAEQPT